MRDLTLFEALTGGAFDRLNWHHSGEFDQNFSKKSNVPGFARGGWAVLELTGTLPLTASYIKMQIIVKNIFNFWNTAIPTQLRGQSMSCVGSTNDQTGSRKSEGI